MDTTKFMLIFKREYITRVRTKAFILSTILAPLGLLILIVVPIILGSMQTEQRQIIGIQDETSTLLVRLLDQNPDRYIPLPSVTSDSLRTLVLRGNVDGYIVITEEHIDGSKAPELFYTGTGGLSLVSEIRGDIRAALQNERLDRAEVGEAVREILAMRTSLQTRVLTETGEQKSDTMSLFFVGYIMFFIIYAAMFGYGAVIMRSVIEEKSSRIIEVITSSVRPFELLLGKVIGVGALGLTQFAIWSVTGAGLLALAAPLAGLLMGGGGSSADMGAAAAQADLPFDLPSIGAEVWVTFILFFLAGYLIYSSLYAAVGSAVDAESDANQLMIPLMIPIMLPLLFIGNVASDPNSTFSVITSLVPFFAPMLMPMRVAMTPVPFWEVALGLILCIITFIGIMWLSARIYRVGILMYGKKASFGELFKWVRYN
jgi:ABC-2 type transport system permease protein